MNGTEEYSRQMREKRIRELEDQVAWLEHQHKNDHAANLMLMSLIKEKHCEEPTI